MIANREAMVEKIALLPEPLIQEVSDFIDFLLTKKNQHSWYTATHIAEGTTLSESDMSDYLTNLEAYEDRLAQGEIRW